MSTTTEMVPVEAPKVLDFTGTGPVAVTPTGPKVDRDAVKAAMVRIEKYEADIHDAEDYYQRGQWNETTRHNRVAAAREAIASEYEALNMRLTVHAHLREHGLI